MAPTLTPLGVAVTGGASGASRPAARTHVIAAAGKLALPVRSLIPPAALIAVGTRTTAWSHPITPAAAFVLDPVPDPFEPVVATVDRHQSGHAHHHQNPGDDEGNHRSTSCCSTTRFVHDPSVDRPGERTVRERREPGTNLGGAARTAPPSRSVRRGDQSNEVISPTRRSAWSWPTEELPAWPRAQRSWLWRHRWPEPSWSSPASWLAPSWLAPSSWPAPSLPSTSLQRPSSWPGLLGGRLLCRRRLLGRLGLGATRGVTHRADSGARRARASGLGRRVGGAFGRLAGPARRSLHRLADATHHVVELRLETAPLLVGLGTNLVDLLGHPLDQVLDQLLEVLDGARHQLLGGTGALAGIVHQLLQLRRRSFDELVGLQVCHRYLAGLSPRFLDVADRPKSLAAPARRRKPWDRIRVCRVQPGELPALRTSTIPMAVEYRQRRDLSSRSSGAGQGWGGSGVTIEEELEVVEQVRQLGEHLDPTSTELTAPASVEGRPGGPDASGDAATSPACVVRTVASAAGCGPPAEWCSAAFSSPTARTLPAPLPLAAPASAAVPASVTPRG